MASLTNGSSSGDNSHVFSEAQQPVRYEVVGSGGEGLNLNLRHNLFQGAVVLVSALFGAIIGFNALTEMPVLGAVYGVAIGMMAGTFASGLLLLFFARRPKQLTLNQYIQLGRQSRRRACWAMGVFLANGLAGIIFFPFLAHHDAPWAFVVCILGAMTWVGSCTYANLSAGCCSFRLKCPNCGKAVRIASEHCNQCCQRCEFLFF